MPQKIHFLSIWVVIGNALSLGNKEVEYIMEKKIPYFSMPEIIKKFFLKNNYPIVITGTHGKTTTSSLIAYLLDKLTEILDFLLEVLLIVFQSTGDLVNKMEVIL